MTEEEAKTRWCPFARLEDNGGTYNRCGPKSGVNCIGSDCMAWRWNDRLAYGALIANGAHLVGGEVPDELTPALARKQISHGVELLVFAGIGKGSVPRGYCGLAGKS